MANIMRQLGARVTTERVLAALARLPQPATTEDLVDELGRSETSRHVVYRRLTALEGEGRVEKDISHRGSGIGTALWSIASPPPPELRRK